MSAEIPDVDRRVLGAGTTLRFVLLVVLIGAICIQMIATIGRRARDETQGQLFTLPWAWGVAGTTVVLGIALLHYWLLPWLKVRRSRLVPIRGGELAAELRRLAERAGLDKQPLFVMDWAAATPSAVVFGRWRQPVVSLHGGLIALRRRDPQGFDAVVLHELAHIRNRDVDIVHATEALWRVFAVFVLLPYTVMSIYPDPWQRSPAEALEAWRSGWEWYLHGLLRIAVYVALVLLARADVLRTRELYADLDAARWGGGQRPLVHLDGGGDSGWLRDGLRRFRALWRTHPAWVERAESLVAPGPLFGVRALTMFLTGVTVMVAAGELGSLPRASLRMSAGSFVPADWAMAALVTGIVGTAVWRAVAHAVLTSQPAPSGLRAGLWLGLGLAVGELLSFRLAVGELMFPRASGVPWLPREPQLLLLLVAAVAVLTWWAAQCAELWVGTHRGRTLLGIHLVGLSVMLVVFGAWFAWWNSGGYLYTIGAVRKIVRGTTVASIAGGVFSGTPEQQEALLPLAPETALVVALGSNPMVAVGGALLWLFPLAAWARRPVDGVPGWVSRSLPTSQHWAPAVPERPRLGWVLSRGIEGAALCLCAVAGTRWLLHLNQPPREERLGAWAFYNMLWTTVALVGTAAVVAAVVCASIPRHQLPVALSTAGTALLGGLAGTFLLAATEGCLPPLETTSSVCGWKQVPAWQMMYQVVGPYSLGLGIYVVAVATLAGLAGRFLAERIGLAQRLATWHTRPPRGTAEARHPSPSRIMVVGALGGAAGVAAVAGTRAWLHTNQPSPGQSFVARVEDSSLWMASALVGGTTLALAVTAGRWRWQRPATVLAAVLALLLGLAGTFVLMATDGCVSGLEVLASTCQWRPGPSRKLIVIVVIPCVVALGTCALAVFILGGLMRRRTAPARPTRVARIAGRAYIGMACITTAVVLSGLGALADQADRTVTQPMTSCPDGSRDPCREVLGQRTVFWAADGGLALLGDLGRDFGTLGSALKESARQGGRISVATYRPLCEKWTENGHRATKLEPPPEPESSKLWNQLFQYVEHGGKNCLDGLKLGDAELLESGFADLSLAARLEADLVDRLDSLTGSVR